MVSLNLNRQFDIKLWDISSHRLAIAILMMFFFTIGLTGQAHAQMEAAVPASGISKEMDRPRIASLKGVNIDHYQGNVSIIHNDVLLKGNGGLDIVVNRAYSSQGLGGSKLLYADGTESYTNSYKWVSLGLGWSMHVAPQIEMSLPSGGGAWTNDADSICKKVQPTSYDAIYKLIHTDGRQERMFNSGIGVVTTVSNWRLTCAGVGRPHQLQGPDGTVYLMGERHEGAITTSYTPDENGVLPTILVVQATRITDKNGNWLNITYTTPNPTSNWGERTSHLPLEITSNDGRRLNFTYDGGNNEFDFQTQSYLGSPPRLLNIVGPSGAVWQYRHLRDNNKGTYDNLVEVINPDGGSWKFNYFPQADDGNPDSNLISYIAGSKRLRSMTVPTGGVVDFTYQYSTSYMRAAMLWTSGASTVSTQVKSVKTSDGGVWDYSFAPGRFNGEFDVTTVNSQDGSEVYKYIGVGYFVTEAESRLNPLAAFSGYEKKRVGAWQLGLLMEKRLGTDFTETYQYVGRPLSDFSSEMILGRTLIYDKPAKAPQLSQRTTTLNGVSYVSNLSGFDQFGNVSIVSQVGPSGESRASNTTYYVNTEKWIVNQPKNESATGSSIVREFDTKGNMLSQSLDGVTTTYTYDGQGNVATIMNPRGFIHKFSNYKRGIAQTESHPEGVNITRIVSDAGNIESETNGEGMTTTFEFDSANRETRKVYPTGLPASVSYSTQSKTVTRGDLVEFTQFDTFGRPNLITLGGISRSFGYDAFGRKTFESNPNSSAGTTYTYDILGRTRIITNPDGTFSKIDYQGVNKLIYDEKANLTTYSYRSYGKPSEEFVMKITTSDPTSTIVIGRNAKDLVDSVTQNGFTRTYGYNANYFLTTVINPETGTTVYERDAEGNMISRTVGNSGKTIFTYDGQNRLTNITYPDGSSSVIKAYTKTHRLKSVTTTAAIRSYDYDANDNLTKETLSVDGHALTLGYGYNGKDQLESLTYPKSGTIINYAPDALGRPTQISGVVSNVQYWPSGLVKQITYNNGVVTSYGQHVRLWPNSFDSNKGNIQLNKITYNYDATGNLIQIGDAMDGAYNRTMIYDSVNRLTFISGPWGAGAITYDGNGNIRSQELGGYQLYQFYDNKNRLNNVSGARTSSYAYDAYGNIISGSGNTYNYDAAGNLRCINCTNSSLKILHIYDGQNQRVSVTKAGVTKYEMYGAGGNQILEFTPSQTNGVIEYYYLAGKRIAQRIRP